MTDRKRLARLIGTLVLISVVGLSAASRATAQGPAFTGTNSLMWGTPQSGAWQSGAPYYRQSATSPAGINSMLIMIDGTAIQTCVAGCSGGTLSTNLPTTRFADGEHRATVVATDNAGASNSLAWTLRIDNTAPAAPGNVRVDGGASWRAQPAVRASWSIPGQSFAPLNGLTYELCPVEVDSGDPGQAAAGKSRCVQKTLASAGLAWAPGPLPTSLPEGLALPSPGQWRLRIWLRDVAGNQNADGAAVVSGVGYDPTPPQVAGFSAQDPDDPARASVAATDDGAPITGGSIEVQRAGETVWRPLAAHVTPGGLSALVDDEALHRGRYTLRATVVNAAGLQQGTDRGADGSVKTLKLPIRRGTAVQAGRRVGRVCHRRGKRRSCHFKLSQRIPVALGRPITLRARASSQGRPLARQALEVWERISIAGATWKQIATVHSNDEGRVRYKAAPGPARRLRFRYPGSAQVRGDNSTVALMVRASSSIEVSRRSVINGEYVTFRGMLNGRPIPDAGALVELQVRSRGKWRTFAQPRANADGKWQYQYRFETVSGGAAFRFRARVRRQAGYPYATGSSRGIGVRVHGL